MDSMPAKEDPDGSKYTKCPHVCAVFEHGPSPQPHRDFATAVLRQERYHAKRYGPLEAEEARRLRPLIVDPLTGRGFRKRRYMKFFYIMLDLVFKRFYGQTYTLLTLMLYFGYHGYRAQFKNDMDGAGTPPSLSETVGHWAAGSRARLQYTRQKRGEMIAYQRRAALTEGTTLPEVFHEVETALRADTSDQAGGKTRITTSAASPPVPPGANCESPIALAWEPERQAEGGEPNLTLPAAGVPPARAPPPTGLIGTRVALTSLDASIPFANKMFARPGQPQHVGRIVAVISPEEEDRTGEYEVQAAFTSSNASQTQYVTFPASEVAAVTYVGDDPCRLQGRSTTGSNPVPKPAAAN